MGAGDKLDSIRLKIEELIWQLKERASLILKEKSKTYAVSVFAGAGLLVLVIVITFIVISLSVKGRKKENAVLFPPEKVSDEDFFLPAEPDFLPPVILYREPKPQWTQEDAEAFWTDPASLGDGLWEQKTGEYVDKLLESVP